MLLRAAAAPFAARLSMFCLCALVACGSGEDGSTESTATSIGEVGGEASAGGTDAEATSSSDEGSTEETGGPTGEEYGPCTDVFDCPEGMLYACLQDVTEGAVCAPGCMDHSDCPPPPPGGSTMPVCTMVDDRLRCAMLGCQSDEDCPTGMTCHIEGPNWCHWPF